MSTEKNNSQEKTTLIILNESDIAFIAGIIKDFDFDEIAAFDITLIDKIKLHTNKTVRFINPINHTDINNRLRLSEELAKQVEDEINLKINKSKFKIESIGWNFRNYSYLFQTLIWYRNLFKGVSDFFIKNKIIFFIPNKNPSFYLTSFLPSLILYEHCIKDGIKFEILSYDMQEPVFFTPDKNQELPSFDILTYIPTLFYDQHIVDEAIKRLNLTPLLLDSPLWNVDLHGYKNIKLRRIAEDEISTSEIFKSISDTHLEVLAPYISAYIENKDYIKKICLNYSKNYYSQFLTFDYIKNIFETRKFKFILSTEHDAGFHGPLITAAKEFNMPVVMIPHSKVMPKNEFNHKKIFRVAHAIQNPKSKSLNHFHSHIDYKKNITFTQDLYKPKKNHSSDFKWYLSQWHVLF